MEWKCICFENSPHCIPTVILLSYVLMKWCTRWPEQGHTHCALVVHIAPDGAHKGPVYHWNGAQGCLRKPTHTHTHMRMMSKLLHAALTRGCKDLLCNLTNKEHLIVWLWSLFTHKLRFPLCMSLKILTKPFEFQTIETVTKSTAHL